MPSFANRNITNREALNICKTVNTLRTFLDFDEEELSAVAAKYPEILDKT